MGPSGVAGIRSGLLLLLAGWLNRCSKRDKVSTAIRSEVFSFYGNPALSLYVEIFSVRGAEGADKVNQIFIASLYCVIVLIAWLIVFL